MPQIPDIMTKHPKETGIILSELHYIESDLERMRQEIEKIDSEKQRLYDEYVLRSFDVILDVLKNLLTVGSGLFAATFAISINPRVRLLSGIFIFVVLILMIIALVFRLSTAKKNAKSIRLKLRQRLAELKESVISVKKQHESLKKWYESLKSQ